MFKVTRPALAVGVAIAVLGSASAAYAVFSDTVSVSGTVAAGVFLPVTVINAKVMDDLYPGENAGLRVRVQNGNDVEAKITGIRVGDGPWKMVNNGHEVTDPAVCSKANAAISLDQNAIGQYLADSPVVLGRRGGADMTRTITISHAVLMGDSATGCAGALFRFPVIVTAQSYTPGQ